MLNETKEAKKANFVCIIFYEISRRGKLMETAARLEIIRRIRERENEELLLLVIEFLSGVMKMFWKQIVVTITKHDECN